MIRPPIKTWRYDCEMNTTFKKLCLHLSKLKTVVKKHISYACMTMDFWLRSCSFEPALLLMPPVAAVIVVVHSGGSGVRCENIKDYDTFA